MWRRALYVLLMALFATLGTLLLAPLGVEFSWSAVAVGTVIGGFAAECAAVALTATRVPGSDAISSIGRQALRNVRSHPRKFAAAAAVAMAVAVGAVSAIDLAYGGSPTADRKSTLFSTERAGQIEGGNIVRARKAFSDDASFADRVTGIRPVARITIAMRLHNPFAAAIPQVRVRVELPSQPANRAIVNVTAITPDAVTKAVGDTVVLQARPLATPVWTFGPQSAILVEGSPTGPVLKHLSDDIATTGVDLGEMPGEGTHYLWFVQFEVIAAS